MSAAEIDAWLRGGGWVVTASERAARALTSAFHRARRAEGLAAWPAPAVQPWNQFVREAWQHRALDGRLILNSAQEESLWAEVVARHAPTATLLEGPRHRTARLAMEAHALLGAYAPQLLQATSRSGWQQDAAAFSQWLRAFDDACRAGNLISPARLPAELIGILKAASPDGNQPARPPLLLAGFDRIQPIQRSLFDAWGDWREATLPDRAAQIQFHHAPDAQAELEACAIWCSRRLAANPNARLLVVSQDAAARRGEIERAFLRHVGADSLFEFSLGIPLSQVQLAHSAHLLLRWLTGPLTEHELDWLFSTRYAADPQECAALQGAMRVLRRRGLEQPDWPLNAFIAQCAAVQPLPAQWIDRMTQARQRLDEYAHQPHSFLDWSEFASRLLESLGWPAARKLSSAEFQAARRFQQAIETAGSLGFDGRRVAWQDFLSALARGLDETVFTPQSHDAPIQIAGPAESAGLAADAAWFLGASEDAWPVAASTHPLLPAEVQRRFAMPHATAQLDWDLAQSITVRLLASAPEVHCSFARHADGVEMRASRLVAQLAGPPQPLPAELAPLPASSPLTAAFADTSRVAFPPGKVEGGAAVLTAQSQCAFQAFAGVRLAAHTWEPAQPALTPAQRGQLLHAVLHAIWAGPPEGLRNLADLRNLNDRPSFVAAHVRRVFQQKLRRNLRARMPRTYLELEEQRLIFLISAWLDYESTRAEFAVVETEAQQTVHLAGLTFDLRLDRVDRLNDRTLLVIDYKSGNVLPKSWDPPRPDDIQLPLYAGFALPSGEILGGLAFAKLRAGKIAFAGRVGDARATLLPSLGARDALVSTPLTAEQLIDWRDLIQQLARDFLAGRAVVNPRDFPKTCERCGLQTLCRVHENRVELDADENGAELAEAADE